jgi:S-adenosylmethionine synthetase
MNIHQTTKHIFPDDNDIEIVERKGWGHPDTLADGLAERISIDYSKYCLDNFGYVLHHNVDKVCIMGGLSEFDWGKGKFTEPVRVLVNGRMSGSFDGKKIPIQSIIEDAVKTYLNKVMPRFDTENWLIIMNETKQYSRNPRWFNPKSVEDLPEYKNIFANDTSAVVGCWPLTFAESLTLELEGLFYDEEKNPKYSFIGQDIKVMTIRRDNKYSITMCIPFFAQDIKDSLEYKEKKKYIVQVIKDHIQKRFKDMKLEYELHINTQDQLAKGITTAKKAYLVAGGSATDFGEEGCVGRGNNRRGIIPMMRKYSMEAAWGKNPVYHVGKVYGVIVDEMAREIAEHFDCKVEVLVMTRNGDPFFSPHEITVFSSKEINSKELESLIKGILAKRDWTQKILKEEVLLPSVYNIKAEE